MSYAAVAVGLVIEASRLRFRDKNLRNIYALAVFDGSENWL
jgi:hypothetical protein